MQGRDILHTPGFLQVSAMSISILETLYFHNRDHLNATGYSHNGSMNQNVQSTLCNRKTKLSLLKTLSVHHCVAKLNEKE